MKILKFIFTLLFLVTSVSVSTKMYSQNNLVSYQEKDLSLLLTTYKINTERLNKYYNFHSSPQYIKRAFNHFKNYKKVLKNIKYSKLNNTQQVDYQLLKRNLSIELKRLNEKKTYLKATEKWINDGAFLYEIAFKSQQGTTPNPEELAKKITIAINKTKSNIKKIEKENPIFSYEESGFLITALNEQKKALNNLSDLFDSFLPNYKATITNVKIEFEKQIDLFVKKVQEKSKRKEVSPLGKEKFQEFLSETKTIPYSINEISEIATRFFDSSQKETKVISAKMGFGDNWEQAYEKVKSSFVKLGKQPATVLKLQNDALQFIKKNDLVTVPEIMKETWAFGMIPGVLQKRFPFFLGGPKLLIAYPSLSMKKEDQLQIMRMNNPHFSRSVLFHEIIPGHFMQVYFEDIYKPYRKGFGYGSSWAEGMAFYWELLLYEKGFAKSNEDKLGMLFFQKLRAARVITSINYHTKKWTKEQCIAFFKNQVGADDFVAISESNRAFTSYPISYLIGGLQFLSLKKELVDSGKMSLKDFHNKMYQENYIPMNLFRYALKGEKIPEKIPNSWRFQSLNN